MRAKGFFYLEIYLQVIVAILLFFVLFYFLYNFPIERNKFLEGLVYSEQSFTDVAPKGIVYFDNQEKMIKYGRTEMLGEDVAIVFIDGNTLNLKKECNGQDYLQVNRFGYFESKLAKFTYGFCYDK